jgi:hypothetical protein
MAACGGVAVTNAFSVKTVEVLESLSPNIVATEATVEGMAAGLVRAAAMANAGHPREGTLNLPRDWAEALDPAARRVAEVLRGF